MSDFLRRLGLVSFQRKWLVVAIWLALIATAIGLMITYRQPVSTTITIPGTEAQNTIDRAEQLFPSASSGTGRIVFEAPDGKTIDEFRPAIESSLAEAAQAKDVEQVISPFIFESAISTDRDIAFAQLQLSVDRTNISDQTTEEVVAALKTAREAGLVAEAGGDIVRLGPGEIIGAGEIVGVIIAALVLFAVFRAVLAAGLPLIVALFTLAISLSIIMSLGNIIDINSTTPALAIMLGLAVGIDYSLFILSRYRGYILEGVKPDQAIAKAVSTAGNAVIYAASTVVIALSALSVIGIPFITTMGLAAAGTVAVAALAAVTLLPALAGILGKRILNNKQHQRLAARTKKSHATGSSFWHRVGSLLSAKPLPVIALSTLLLVGLAYPAKDLQLGLPTDEHAASDTTQRKAYDMLTRGFGSGFNGPLVVLAENIKAPTDQEVTQTMMALASGQLTIPPELQARASLQPRQPTDPAEISRQLVQYSRMQAIAAEINKSSNVAETTPVAISEDVASALFQVVPWTGPSDSATVDLINDIRAKDLVIEDQAVSLSVTGSTAIQADIDQKLFDSITPYLAITVGLSFVILMVAFRSVLVPIKATLGFLLSVGAMFGALVMAFQWGAFGLFEVMPIISFLPIIGIGILFGLAMDYEFFMTSSIREAFVRSGKAKQSVTVGFSMGAKVVAAAAIIMVSVFGGFVTNGEDIIRQVGFGLAFGILIDAFIIRMIAGPAIMSLLGDKAWYLPGWLSKLVPKVSIEGKG